MVPEPAPLPTRRPLPLGSAWRPLAAGLVCPLAAGLVCPLAAGSAASDATQRAAAADTANAAIRLPRAMAARPRAPRNMRRLHPPAVPPFAVVPWRVLMANASHNWAAEPLRPQWK